MTGTAQNMKNHVAIVVLALEQQLLMPKILRCDVEGTRQILLQLENDCSMYFYLFYFAIENLHEIQIHSKIAFIDSLILYL